MPRRSPPHPRARAARSTAPGLVAAVVAAVVAPAALSGCAKPAPPAPAEVRVTPPPWSAPRDAVSYIEAAGLEQLPLDVADDRRTVRLRVLADGAEVAVPAYVGVDRLRAVQAPAHTHDETGTVFLEGTRGEPVTLGQFATLWGVRLDRRCLGSVCGRVSVTTDTGRHTGDPRDLRLGDVSSITMAATSR